MTTEPARLVRAGCYFVACWAVAAATGVTGEVLTEPVVGRGHLERPAWWALTALCLAVVTIGYWWIWPLGTYAFGRERHVPSVVIFGISWALAEAQLFLVIDRRVGQTFDGRVARAAVGLVVIAAFQGLWHACYWDRQVAPEHNDPSWNLRKVLLCHVPNLMLTLTHLAIYREPLLFIAFQVVALVGSTWHMCFPDVRHPLTVPTAPV